MNTQLTPVNMFPLPPYHSIPEGYGGFIYTPNVNDVLCGRGGRINAHDGNIIFRRIVNMYKQDYLSKSSNKVHKARIAACVVARIRGSNPSGRFLKLDTGTGFWMELGDEKARKKAGQALREDASKFRETKAAQRRDKGVDKAEKPSTSTKSVSHNNLTNSRPSNTSKPNDPDSNNSIVPKEKMKNTKIASDSNISDLPVPAPKSSENALPCVKSSTSANSRGDEIGRVATPKIVSNKGLTNPYTFKGRVSQGSSFFSNTYKPSGFTKFSNPQTSICLHDGKYVSVDISSKTTPTPKESFFQPNVQKPDDKLLTKSHPVWKSSASSVDLSKIEPSALSSDDKTIDSYTLDVVIGIDKSAGNFANNNPVLSFKTLAKSGTFSTSEDKEKTSSDFSSRRIEKLHHPQEEKQQLEELSKELCKLKIRKDNTTNPSDDRRGFRSEWREQMLSVKAFRRRKIEEESDTSSDSGSDASVEEKVCTQNGDGKTKKGAQTKKSRRLSSSLSISSFMSPINFFRKKPKVPPAEKNESCSLNTADLSLKDLVSLGSGSISALCDVSHESNWMNSFRTMMSISTAGDTNISDLTSLTTDLVSLERKHRKVKKIETACC